MQQLSQRVQLACELGIDPSLGDLAEPARLGDLPHDAGIADQRRRHARAADVEVTARSARAMAVLTVRDNGVGISAGLRAKSRLGLLGIKERARTLGGGVRISAGPAAAPWSCGCRASSAAGSARVRSACCWPTTTPSCARAARILDRRLRVPVAGEANNGQEVMAQIRARDFDVLVLDMTMPGRSGIELIKQVKDEKPKLNVLVLTMHSEEQYAVRALRQARRGT